MRAKTAYEMEKDEKGKVVPVKKGMEPIQRAGLEYEFTVVLDMDNTRHTATSGKDRTQMFDGQCFIPDESTGVALMQWLNMGTEIQPQYYQPQQQLQYGAQQPYQQPVYEQPVQQQPVFNQPEPQPPAPIYGFPKYDAEIAANMTATWGNLSGFDIPGYIQTRFGRLPAALTVEECYSLMNEFASYAQQKQGGQQ